MAVLAEQGRGFRIRDVTVPIVPQAILFDLLNGGDKAWGRKPPYFDLGAAACEAAASSLRARHGGRGLRRDHRDAEGRARLRQHGDAAGYTVGAIVAVNAVGSVADGRRPAFLGRALRAGRRVRRARLALRAAQRTRSSPGSRAGRGRARPSRSWPPMRSSPRRSASASPRPRMTASRGRSAPGPHAARRRHRLRRREPACGPLADRHGAERDRGRRRRCLARAIARGVFEARALPFPGALPAWKDRFGRIMVSP